MSNNSNNWKRIGGFSRTGTQNYVRTTDAAMGGTTFGPTDISHNSGNSTLRIGNNAGVVFINGDIDMSGGTTVGAPINRIRNVRDPIMDQDVATKFYVDKTVIALKLDNQKVGPTGSMGPPGIGFGGQDGQEGPTGATGCTGAVGPPGNVIGVKGPTGANGGTGATGERGAAGSTGPAGAAGEKGEQGVAGTQGIQGSNGTILWLNPDGDSAGDQLITDSYLLSNLPIDSRMRTVGPISVSATYGNTNKIIPGSRFYNTARKMSDLAVIPSGVWVLNIYANVPSNSDANQVSIYAAVFMISGTLNQPSPDSLVIETKDGGDAGYYPPRAAYLPDHVKYIGKSWTNVDNVLTDNTTGTIINSTARKLYKVEMPVEFITLRDATGSRENVYVQLQIYIKNTKAANQTANVSLYFQSDLNTNETTYSYLQTTFGAVGIQGVQGTTGPTGSLGLPGPAGAAGSAGSTGSVGPTGSTGAIGPVGPQGSTGVTGPAGSSSSFGVQYAVQYRSNAGIGGPTDASGTFGGSTHFRFQPTAYTTNISDATTGSVITNDIACRSIHSSFYVEDPSITGSNSRPRTFVKGGEAGGEYVILASGLDTSLDGGTTRSPASVSDITHGIKIRHNTAATPPTATIALHNGHKTADIIGMKFDVANGHVIAGQDKFCIVNTTGAVGVGGMTPQEMTASAQSTLNRALHVSGNVMVGTHPGTASAPASSAMIMLNQPTAAPTTTAYPGLYHRNVTGSTATTLDLPSGTSGLGITSSDYITFQTGGATQSNSIVINGAGHVSVLGRTNLNGAVSVGKNFVDVETHDSLRPVMDVSGTMSLSSIATTFTDNPRIKLISKAGGLQSDIPGLSTLQTSNEIRGAILTSNPSLISGFLRLSAQTPANSCIDLIGSNNSGTAGRFSNSVRISTSGGEAMIINGSRNVGIGTTVPGFRLDVSGASSVPAARIMSTATTGTALITTGRIGVNNAAPTEALDVNGTVKVTGNIDMAGSARITNLANPQTDTDAVNRGYVNGRTTGTSTRAEGRQFSINGGTSYGNVAPPTDTMLDVYDPGIGYGARMRLRTYAGNGLTLGAHAYGESYLWNEQGYDIGFGTSGARRMTLRSGGTLDMNSSTRITNMPDPQSTNDAATKNYVDVACHYGSNQNNPTIADSGNQWNYLRLIFTPQSSGRATLLNDGDLYYNPNNNTLYTGTFSGYLSGTASYANSAGSTTYAYYVYYPHIWDSNDGRVWDVVLTGGNGFSALHRATGQYYNRFTCRSNFQGMMTVGFGTDNPQFPVHISAYTYSAWGGWWWDHWYVGFYNIYWNVTTRGWGTTSDKRIKYDIRELNDAEALSDLRKLNPCKFKMYNDEHGTEKYGFVAQEVIKVLPDAVIKMTNFIYNLNCYGNIKKINSDLSYNTYMVTYTSTNNKYPNIIKLKGEIGKNFTFESYTDISGNKYTTKDGKPATDNSGNQHFRVKIVSLSDGLIHECKVIQIIDDYKFIMAKEIAVDLTDDIYYIEGQEINDVHVLHNDIIWAVSTSALQEVDRQQQADKLRIKALEDKVEEQQKTIDTILQKLSKLGV
jgi:hypothetical protein